MNGLLFQAKEFGLHPEAMWVTFKCSFLSNLWHFSYRNMNKKLILDLFEYTVSYLRAGVMFCMLRCAQFLTNA
jgi:hypothetical protein